MIVSNIGITADLSAAYTTNSGMHTAFVLVNLKEEHKLGSYELMERVRRKLATDMPQLTAYFQAGGLVDAVVNQGLPAPLDIQISDNDMAEGHGIAQDIASRLRDAHLAGGAATEEVRAVHAQLRRLAADPSAPPALRAQLRVLAERLARGRTVDTVAVLSAREVDVLAQVALGCTNAEAAKRLSLKPETVKSYLRSATTKLGARTRHEAVAMARQARLLP